MALRLLKNTGRAVAITTPYFAIGIVLTALYQAYFPVHLAKAIFSLNPGFGVLFSAALGVPLYACGGTDNALPDSTPPLVGVAKGTDYASVTAAAIANAGGLQGIVKYGDTVVVKPNPCRPWFETPLATDYHVVAEVVRQVKALGAGRIIVAEGAFDPDPFSAANQRVLRYGTITGIELIRLPERTVITGRRQTVLPANPFICQKCMLMPMWLSRWRSSNPMKTALYPST
jgi:hypothetical protein